MQLNPEQAQVVNEEGNCLVVACPGSGKTRVITTKVGHLLRRYPEARIVAVTFTRDASSELSERIIKEIGEARFGQCCRVGTFHSLAIRQLRNANKIGNNIAGPGQQFALVARAASQVGFDGDLQEAAEIISAAKSTLTRNPAQDDELYQAYAELLSRQRLVDLYDVIRNAVLMMKNKEIHPFPAQFMLVDEFQDTDAIQLEWVMEHVRAGVAVTCVGDDDQAIYAWRGGLGYPGMQSFAAQAKATTITLGMNYRSHDEILTLADRVIRVNEDRIDKRLVAFNGKGGSIHLERIGNRTDEAETVAKHIRSHTVPTSGDDLFQLTVPAGSWAILARNKKHLDDVEGELREHGIRCIRPPGESIWNRPPFTLLVAGMKAVQRADVAAIDSLVHRALSFSHGAGNAEIGLSNLHKKLGDHFAQIIDGIHPPLKDILTSDEAKTLDQFIAQISAWRQQAADGYYKQVITLLAGWIARTEADPDTALLITKLGDWLAKLSGSFNKRIRFVEDALKSDKPAEDGVVLTTMHASKGLEFDHVWLIRCNDGVIPSQKSGNLPEERRLLYVGITRAKKHLYISATTTARVTPLLTEVGIEIEAAAA